MYSSGVWLEHHLDESISVGVTDYHVSEFGDSEWEWSATLDKKNKDKLIKVLQSEFKEKLTLKEMIKAKFTENLSTTEFVKYMDLHDIKYVINRTWW